MFIISSLARLLYLLKLFAARQFSVVARTGGSGWNVHLTQWSTCRFSSRYSSINNYANLWIHGFCRNERWLIWHQVIYSAWRQSCMIWSCQLLFTAPVIYSSSFWLVLVLRECVRVTYPSELQKRSREESKVMTKSCSKTNSISLYFFFF